MNESTKSKLIVLKEQINVIIGDTDNDIFHDLLDISKSNNHISRMIHFDSCMEDKKCQDKLRDFIKDINSMIK